MHTAAIFVSASLWILSATAAIGQVIEVPNISGTGGLRAGGAGSSATNVNVDAFATIGDGGGGEFVRGGSCSVGSDEGGVVIRDGVNGYCWYRQFSGPVHLNWYGVNSAHPSATATLFTNAFNAALNYGNRTVVTDGVAVSYTSTTQSLNIPAGETLDCQGTIGGISGAGFSVPTLSSSLIIDPAVSVTANSRSVLSNCNIRPSWFTTSAPTTTTRDLINILHQFSGTAVNCTDDGCSLQNVAVYGFDVGILAGTTQRFYMNNVLVDSNVGIWWRNLPGAARNTNLIVDPFITQGNPNNEVDWEISGVSASMSGECVLSTSTSNTTQIDDTVYVYGINQTVLINTTGSLTNGSTAVTNIDPSDLQDVVRGSTISAPTFRRARRLPLSITTPDRSR